MINFSSRFKEIRKENNETQTKLSQILDIPRTTIASWENKNVEPSYEMLIKLADYFKVSTDYLLGREDYGTGLINVQNELNKTELEMLEIFKRLTRDNQIRTLGYMSGLMKYQ